MEFSGTLPQPAPPQPGILQTLCWTVADSLTLEQICKDLGISEMELDFCMPHPPAAQISTDVLRTPELRPRKAAVLPKKTRIKSTNKAVTPIYGQIYAPRLPNGRNQKLQLPALLVEANAQLQVRRRPRRQSPGSKRAHPTRP